MKTAALIFGLLAGLMGGLALALGNIETSLADIPALGANGPLAAKFVLYLVPAIGWIGTGVVLARPRIGGFMLLLSAAAWAVLAFAAGHGAVFFAAAPFIFALAAGVVAMFAPRAADPGERRPAPAPAAPAKRPREALPPVRAAAPQRAAPPSRTVAAPQSSAETEERFAAPLIPPPFQDIIPADEPVLGKWPENDPTAPIAAAIATQTVSVVPDAGESVAAPAETAEPVAAVRPPASPAAKPPAPIEPEARELRARRPGDWSLPSPADMPPPRYAAERQAPAGTVVSAPIPASDGEAGMAPAPVPTTSTAMALLAPAPAQPATAEEAPVAAAATLDFAPTDDYRRGANPGEAAAVKDGETVTAPPERPRRRAFGSRRESVAEPDDAPPARRAVGLRRFLRGAIAAVFVIAVAGGCLAAYLDYLRGPQSLLFGRRAQAMTHQVSPAAPEAATAGAAASSSAMPAQDTPAAPVQAKAAAVPSSQPPAVAPAAAPARPAPSEAASPAPAASATTSGTATADPAAAQGFSDPVRYCAAVRTIDAPDSRYAGPAVPPAVATALLLPKSADPSQVHWRCASGVALACNANNTDACNPTPTVKYMLQYCAEHPDAGSMPAPNGSWSCNGTRPVIPEDQSWPVDARGFFPDAWVRVSPIGAG